MGLLIPPAPHWMLQRMSRSKNELKLPQADSLPLNVLQERCPRFAEDWEKQRLNGLDEETWFRWSATLANAGFLDEALEFSRVSHKHDQRSENRIKLMARSVHGPTRCTTFGCGEDQILKCFEGQVRKNSAGEITNSPASFLRKSVTPTERVLPEQSQDDDLPEGYVIENGFLCEVSLYKGKAKATPLSNFLARPTKIVVKDDGLEKQRFYEIEGMVLQTGRLLPPVLVPAEKFPAMQWPAEWDLEPNLFPGPTVKDKVRFVVQHLGRNASEESIFTHLGWRKINGKWSYLHANGCIGANNIKVELDPRLQKYSLPDLPGDRIKAMEASLALLDVAPLRVTLPLFALVYLAPLREWLKQADLVPAFIFWLYGYTGTRKSSLAAMFLCHFGTFTAKTPPASFKDTPNSLEKRAFDCKDSILLVDDYHPTASPIEGKKMEQIAQQLLRGYGDLVGRGRMRPDATLRPTYEPRGLCLVTAEDLISGGSSNARLFPTELLPGDVDLAKLTQAQKNAKLPAQAMVGYLEWLGQAMQDRTTECLTAIFHEKREEATQLNVHGRLVEAATSLYMGLHFALEYAASIGAINAERREQLLSVGWELFLGLAKEQGEQVTDVKPTTRFLSIVSELLANGSIHTVSARLLANDDAPRSGTCVGWHDNEFFYFLPDVLYNTVSQFLSRQGEQFPISKINLWRQLADEGFTQIETEGKHKRYTKKKTIGNFRNRLLWVKVSALRGAEVGAQERPSTRVRQVKTKAFSLGALFAPEDQGNAPTT